MKRSQVVRVRVTPEVMGKLEAKVLKDNSNLSLVVNEILESYFNDTWEKSLAESSFNSVSRIEKQLKQVIGDNEALFDFLSLYVFQWCCHLPELSPSQKQSQVVDGQRRYDEFIKVLKKVRQERKSFAALILDDLRRLYTPVKAA